MFTNEVSMKRRWTKIEHANFLHFHDVSRVAGGLENQGKSENLQRPQVRKFVGKDRESGDCLFPLFDLKVRKVCPKILSKSRTILIKGVTYQPKTGRKPSRHDRERSTEIFLCAWTVMFCHAFDSAQWKLGRWRKTSGADKWRSGFFVTAVVGGSSAVRRPPPLPHSHRGAQMTGARSLISRLHQIWGSAPSVWLYSPAEVSI